MKSNEQRIEEAIEQFLEKKQNNQLSSSVIRKELEATQEFTPAEISEIMRSISDIELTQIQNKQSAAAKFFNSIYFSYTFILFGLAVIGTSLYFISIETRTEMIKYLPWAMILGALFIISKHASKIYTKNKTRKS